MPEPYPVRLSNHAAGLVNSPKRKAALAYLKRAARLDPQPGILCNLAIVLTNFGYYNDASELLHKLVTHDENDLGAWHAYGVLSLVAGMPEDAVECFKKCVALDPNNGTNKFDHSLALMQAGRWEEGWDAYECRRMYKPERIFRDLPRWDGTPNKNVYVWAEQGIGDTFQFARYLAPLKEISKRVVLAIPPSLHEIFAGYKEIGVEILNFNTDAAGIDAEISLLSLPRLLGPTPDRWPADPKLLAKTVQPKFKPLAFSPKLKIGICWACNGASYHNAERSIPFEEMLQLAEEPDADFYSLQVGTPVQDIYSNAAQLIVTDLSAETSDDWCATAAAIKSMDIVVTTDTSVAHLAAILGRNTVMLLARRDWWRWGNEGLKTPWYPTMTVIRQAKPHAWAAEIQQASVIIGHAARAHCANLAA